MAFRLVGNMQRVLKQFAGSCKASDISRFLEMELYGNDMEIEGASPLNAPCENSIVFSKADLDDHYFENFRRVCLIVPTLPKILGSNAFIVTKNPRLAFAKVLQEFFLEKKQGNIGQFSVIGRNVEIGEGTEIRHHVVIADGVKIGRYCLIRSHCVIGEEGFGFEYEEDGTPIRIPHLGSVKIGDYVELGNFTVIAKGTLGNTVIKSNVKTDNLVHIGHNSIIGENSLFAACSEISGSIVVGKNCWFGPNSSTKQKVRIGDNAVIGVGAVILKDVPPGAIMVGNPARILRFRKGGYGL